MGKINLDRLTPDQKTCLGHVHQTLFKEGSIIELLRRKNGWLPVLLFPRQVNLCRGGWLVSFDHLSDIAEIYRFSL